MRRGTVMLLLAAAACQRAPSTEETDVAAPTFRWASAFAKYADCTLEHSTYPEGNPRPVYVDEWVYDANGLWVRHTKYDHYYADGDAIVLEERDIDDLGRVLVYRDIDPATGEVWAMEQTEWDDLGPVSQVQTSPVGAFADAHYTFTHDDLGRLLTVSGDYDPFDDDPEEIGAFEYGADDRLGRGGFYDQWFADHDTYDIVGEPSLDRYRTSDDEGRQVHVDRTEYYSGQEPLHLTADWTYDADGREERVDGVCEAPCWSFDYSVQLFEWTCPGDAT